MEAHVLSAAAAEKLLRADLGTNAAGTALRATYAADCIRSLLSLRGPASPLRLTNHLRRTLPAIWPGFWRANLADGAAPSASAGHEKWELGLLAALKSYGDILSGPAGVFEASGLRLVNIGPGARYALVVGGAANAFTRRWLSDIPIASYGLFRYVDCHALERSMRCDETAWQHLFDWIGITVRDLRSWTQEMLAQHQKIMLSGPPLGLTNDEVYLTERGRGRWPRIDALRECPVGMQLCRADATDLINPGRWRRRHYLGFLTRSTDGAIRVLRSSIIEPNDSKRLVFGLDAALGESFSVPATVVKDLFSIRILRSLPRPENRLLQWAKVVGTEQDVAERVYTFPNHLLPLVARVLANLGIGVTASASAP